MIHNLDPIATISDTRLLLSPVLSKHAPSVIIQRMSTSPADPRLPWLRLARLSGIGPVLIKRLLNHFHSANAILTAHPASLSAIEGIGTYRANQILSSLNHTLAPAQEELQRIDEDEITLLTPDDPRWPPGFRNIPDPPVVLYVRGEIQPEDAVAVGIVGARQCTLYGREQAHRFAADMAQAGLTIISGGARRYRWRRPAHGVLAV